MYVQMRKKQQRWFKELNLNSVFTLKCVSVGALTFEMAFTLLVFDEYKWMNLFLITNLKQH